ncbi:MULTISPECIES: hypothetical protein [unclassified Streptomyces]|uniref:hypothetical protein n=1 Tax=unclassified Streptomyces TaxID=2593676 RepID=UPI001F072BF9|nr:MULTISPECIES: hypothetical protein [unclassified Streptomyces]
MRERLDESTPSLDNGLRPPIRAVAADAERPLSIRVHAPQPAGGDRAASAADLLAPGLEFNRLLGVAPALAAPMCPVADTLAIGLPWWTASCSPPSATT